MADTNTDSKAPSVKDSIHSMIGNLAGEMADGFAALANQKQESKAPAETPSNEETPDSSQESTTEAADEAAEETDVLSQTEEDTEASEEAATEEAEKPKEEEAKIPQKRLDKEIAKRKALEERLAELEAKLTSAKPEVVVEKEIIPADPENPYATLQTETDVEKAVSNARSWKRWLELNEDGFTGPDPFGSGKEVDWSKADIRKMRLDTSDALEEHLPKQREYVRRLSQAEAEAAKSHPFWNDRTSKEYQEAQKILREKPYLRKDPEWKITVGDIVMARMARTTKTTPIAKILTKPAATKKAPSQPSASQSPAPVDEKVARQQAVRERILKKPTADSLRDYIYAGLENV